MHKMTLSDGRRKGGKGEGTYVTYLLGLIELSLLSGDKFFSPCGPCGILMQVSEGGRFDRFLLGMSQ